MKTNKFCYHVTCYDESLSCKEFVCVTLAEARLVASRCLRAQIICFGKINYENGLEVD